VPFRLGGVKTDAGGMLIVQSAANECFIAGAGLSVSFFRDPDVNNKLSGISSIAEVEQVDGKWVTVRRLNGDQTNQGRQLLIAPHQVHVYRVTLYAIDRTSKEP
jgi:hypothetical protein